MRPTYDPFRLLLISLAGWMNQQQADVIDYLHEENRVLRERNHQGLGNQFIMKNEFQVASGRPIQRRERLGGMLNYYYREAA